MFRDAPVIAGTPADSARLRAYGARLLALASGRTAEDGASYYDEMAPSVADWTLLYGKTAIPSDSLRRRWAANAVSGKRGALVPFGTPDVRLRSWAGGRVWELYRDGEERLLSDLDGGGGPAPVFVGEVDGRLRVVR